MPGFIGATELIVLALVALLVFGPKRLPEMGRSLGRGLREFKDSVSSKDGDAATTPAAVLEQHVGTDTMDEDPFAEVRRIEAEQAATARTEPVA